MGTWKPSSYSINVNCPSKPVDLTAPIGRGTGKEYSSLKPETRKKLTWVKSTSSTSSRRVYCVAGTTLQGRLAAAGLRKMVLPGTNRLASSAHLPRTGWLPIPATTLSPLLHHSSGVAAPFTLVAKGPRPAFSTTFTSSSSQTTYSAKVQKKRRYFAKFDRQDIWSAKGSNLLL